MKLVTPQVASVRAVDGHCAWFDLAWGVAHDLQRKLGPPSIGDHLPGLGELSGWGLMSDDQKMTGAIYTGFRPRPTSVMMMLSGRCSGTALSLASLALLLELPSGCFERFTIRSLISGVPAERMSDRGETVLESRSRRALQLAELLTTHLVGDSELAISHVTAANHPPLRVLTGDDCISRFTPGELPDPRAVTVSDWESL
jgi:hypothetical protein